MSDLIDLDPDTLTFAEVVDVARHDAKVRLSEATLARVNKYREAVDALAQAEKPVYGVSTGFGALAQRHIPTELRTQLQKSLIRSHAAGVGEPVEREVVRALMLLRARTMATGRAGVRAEVLQTYVELLNAGITPVVHEYGSLGCSGDLAPLSACALVVMGEGVAEGPDGVAGPPEGARSLAFLVDGHGMGADSFLVLVNMDPVDCTFTLPEAGTWWRTIDTAAWAEDEGNWWPVGASKAEGEYHVHPWSVAVLQAPPFNPEREDDSGEAEPDESSR